MDTAIHLLLFLLSAGLLWFFAGILIEAVGAVAKRYNQSGFTVAFFVLGFLTSIGEIAVAVSSGLSGTPQVAVGNIVGASFVILLLIVPLLAIIGNGVHLKETLNKRQLAIALLVISLPALFVLDGNVRVSEGILSLLAYSSLLYFLNGEKKWWQRKKEESVPEIIEEVEEEIVDKRRATRIDAVKIISGAIIIFFAGNLLVSESVYFSGLLNIPSSIIGLLFLSIGTNAPEIVIAIRAIREQSMSIAFGDYVGSAVTNTIIFSFLALFNGRFLVEPGGFYFTASLLVTGLAAFFLFSNSRTKISRWEGVILISFYAVFVLTEIASLVWFLG